MQKIPTHLQSILIEVEGGDDLLNETDVEEIVETINTEINIYERSGKFALTSGKTVNWSYEQPVH